jgi:hypothetical protein
MYEDVVTFSGRDIGEKRIRVGLLQSYHVKKRSAKRYSVRTPALKVNYAPQTFAFGEINSSFIEETARSSKIYEMLFCPVAGPS